MKKKSRKRARGIKELINTKSIVSIIVLAIFLGTLVLAFAPSIFYGLFLKMKPLSDIPLTNIDTGQEAPFKKFSSKKMLVIVFDNTRSDDLDKVIDMISELKDYIESKGFRIVFVLSGGDKEALVNYLTQERPYLFNALTWLYDREGLLRDKLGANLSRTRIYYISNTDWDYQYIGDSSITRSSLVFKINKLS